MYSPATLSASISGRNTKIVVSDEVSKGNARERLEFASACSRSSPSSNLLLKSSATTMPLSTSTPNEIINVANDMRSSTIPENAIIEMVMSITLGTIPPTMSPAFTPKNSNTTALTIARVSNTLILTPLMAFCTTSACRVIVVSCMPTGNIRFKLASCASICGLKVNTSTWSFFAIANTMTGLPLR